MKKIMIIILGCILLIAGYFIAKPYFTSTTSYDYEKIGVFTLDSTDFSISNINISITGGKKDLLTAIDLNNLNKYSVNANTDNSFVKKVYRFNAIKFTDILDVIAPESYTGIIINEEEEKSQLKYKSTISDDMYLMFNFDGTEAGIAYYNTKINNWIYNIKTLSFINEVQS